jgi:hypothetical protein
LDPPLFDLALRRQDADLALALVQTKPDIGHGGWPPFLRFAAFVMTAFTPLWGDSATTRGGWPAASFQLSAIR